VRSQIQFGNDEKILNMSIVLIVVLASSLVSNSTVNVKILAPVSKILIKPDNFWLSEVFSSAIFLSS